MSAGREQANVMGRLTNYVSAGASAAIAVDTLMVLDAGMSPAAWAAIRGVTTRAVEKNVEKGIEQIPGVSAPEADR